MYRDISDTSAKFMPSNDNNHPMQYLCQAVKNNGSNILKTNQNKKKLLYENGIKYHQDKKPNEGVHRDVLYSDERKEIKAAQHQVPQNQVKENDDILIELDRQRRYM